MEEQEGWGFEWRILISQEEIFRHAKGRLEVAAKESATTRRKRTIGRLDGQANEREVAGATSAKRQTSLKGCAR